MDSCRNASQSVPTVAKPLGMFLAAGSVHVCGRPSLSSKTCAPCRCTIIGCGPVYGGGVLVNVGVESRPALPPGGLAQWMVGSTVSRWGRKLLFESTSWLIQVTRVCLLAVFSRVQPGELNEALLPGTPYPLSVVLGIPEGSTCAEIRRCATVYSMRVELFRVGGIAG